MPGKEFIGHNISPDEANKKLNLSAAMYGFKDPAFRDQPADDPSAGFSSDLFGDGWEQLPAPSTGKRRRAWYIGYHRGMKLLVVVFTTKTRKTSEGKRVQYGTLQPWWKYEECSLEMWDELTGYHSTGEWLSVEYPVGDSRYSPTSASELDTLTEEYQASLLQQNS